MLDERGATWRMFLPAGITNRVLTFCVDMGTVAGLARVGGTVTVVEPNLKDLSDLQTSSDIREKLILRGSLNDIEGPYSLIVLGNLSKYSRVLLQRVVPQLAGGGVLACLQGLGCKFSEDSLRAVGLYVSEEIAALPPGRARVFFPIGSRRVRERGLTFHMPGSARARTAIRGLGLVSRIGWVRPLKRGAVVLASKQPGESADTTLLNWLSDRIGRPFHGLVVYAGSDSIRRKMTALAVSADEDCDVVVKIADSELGAEAIRQESTALRALMGSAVMAQVPTLLFEDTFLDGSLVQAQSALPEEGRTQVPVLTDAHLSFLGKLTKLEQRRCRLSELSVWAGLKDVCRKTAKPGFPEVLWRVLSWLDQRAAEGAKVMLHRTHGDFAPWNIRAYGDELLVFDWEDSRPDGLPGSDLFHFLYYQADCVGPWLGGEVLCSQMKKNYSLLSHFSNTNVRFTDAFALWCSAEYFNRPSAHIEELINVFSRDLD